MRCSCNREALRAAFDTVAAYAPTRSPKPILATVLFQASDDGVTMTATDLETSIALRCLGVDIQTPGSVLLPTEAFRRVLATSNDATLDLESSDDRLTVQGTFSEFEFGVEDVSLYPAPSATVLADYFAIPAAQLRLAIKRTTFATDPDSTRFALGGVLVQQATDTLSFVATDGRRLAKQTVSVDHEGTPSLSAPPIIPRRSLELLAKHLDDEMAPVHFGADGSGVWFRTETAVVRSRLVEGRFPRYMDVFPATCEAKVPLVVGSLRRAVEHAAVVTTEESRGIDFHFGKNVLAMRATAVERGRSKVSLPIDHEGPEVAVTFDPAYLTQALKALPDEAPIVAELVDAKNAVVFATPDRDYLYVVMPMSRER